LRLALQKGGLKPQKSKASPQCRKRNKKDADNKDFYHISLFDMVTQ